VIRAVAADLAARADFEVDSIDDLRMAVDDACTMLIEIAAQGATLSCRFTVRPRADRSGRGSRRRGRGKVAAHRIAWMAGTEVPRGGG
jgi:hypothetical protein